MKVYRIVCHAGKGMYSSDLWREATNGHGSMRQPGPWADGITNFNDDHVFGFASKYQLRRWVHRKAWRAKMAELGGKVEVFKVPNVHTIRGNSQVVFIAEFAQKIAELAVDAI